MSIEAIITAASSAYTAAQPLVTNTGEFIKGALGFAEPIATSGSPAIPATVSPVTHVPLTAAIPAVAPSLSTAAQLGQATTGLAKLGSLGVGIASATGAFTPKVPALRSRDEAGKRRKAAEEEERRRTAGSRSRLAPTGTRNRESIGRRAALGGR